MLLLALTLASAPASADEASGPDPAWQEGFADGRAHSDTPGRVVAGSVGYCTGCVMGMGGACVTWPLARASGMSLEDTLLIGSVQLTDTLLPLPAPYAEDAYAEGYLRGSALTAADQRERAAERGIQAGYATAGLAATVFLIATLAF